MPHDVVLGLKRHTGSKGRSAYDPPNIQEGEVDTLLSIKWRAWLEYAAIQAKGDGASPRPEIQSLFPVNGHPTGIDHGVGHPIPGS